MTDSLENEERIFSEGAEYGERLGESRERARIVAMLRGAVPEGFWYALMCKWQDERPVGLIPHIRDGLNALADHIEGDKAGEDAPAPGEPATSGYLNTPCRSAEAVALEIARGALRWLGTHGEDTNRRRARKALTKIDVLVGPEGAGR